MSVLVLKKSKSSDFSVSTVLQQPLQYLCSTDAGWMDRGDVSHYICCLRGE